MIDDIHTYIEDDVLKYYSLYKLVSSSALTPKFRSILSNSIYTDMNFSVSILIYLSMSILIL